VYNFLWIDAKIWGVVFMGLAIVMFFFLPWLDRSPVKSIRYRGWIYKTALTLFLIAFIVLGYLGMKPASGINLILAQIFSVIYFAFFVLMPWYTKIDKTKPVPERLT
jgi:ubiquinol-cytochrome c reductase cytochrome b subunit